MVARADQSGSYQISVQMTRQTAEQVALSVSNIPQKVDYSFTAVSGSSSYLSRLEVKCGSVPVGVYYLTLRAISQTRSHSLQLELIVDPTSKVGSSIKISVEPEALMLGQNATVSGFITPPHNATVDLQYRRPDGLIYHMSQKTNKDGTFTFTFSPDSSGSWIFSASWAGDSSTLGATSARTTLSVRETSPLPATQFFNALGAVPMSAINMIAGILLVTLVVTLAGALLAMQGKSRKQPR
jgi:hypothetical protein